ncbi:hypothetical protein K488DRAFT_72333 [Vararia minispora EC-137]|uniref:Uncharacterized protein n=1 Tax=Vararia minispora EC-137 TaxID=1314806 RepID=A0ACB8QEU5_9AGAM|nr:hypothetical protein K488DRAFT_72333 [Vararia minispora EC-137]
MHMENSGNYTILRIKRKRTDEPLDALVIDGKVRRKKSKGGLDMFRFAETVEEAAWDDEQRTKDLQERISALARAEHQAAGSKQAASSSSTTPSRTASTHPRQYRIVPHEADTATDARGSPKLRTVGEPEQQKAHDFRMFDAVPMAAGTVAPVSPVSQEDPEMENFLPLLQAYLKVNDIEPVADHSTARAPFNLAVTPPALSPPRVHPNEPQLSHIPTPGEPVVVHAPAPPLPTDDPEYVWDVFYHQAGLADDYEEMPNANIGTLTGLPASFDDPFSSDEESEPEDEADEDSNVTSAEEYYKNDYPDEESDDSGYDDDSSGAPCPFFTITCFSFEHRQIYSTNMRTMMPSPEIRALTAGMTGNRAIVFLLVSVLAEL